MKKIFITLVVVFACYASWSQTTIDTTNSKSYVYCELVGISNFLGTKVTVSIDFGQAKGFFEDTRLRDKNGDLIKFNSMVDAMNYMGLSGWEFVQAYVVTTGNQSVYRWLLKKYNIKSKEELIKSINSLKSSLN